MALWQESVVGVINFRTDSRVGTNLLPLANTPIHTRWIAWVWELRHAMHCSGPHSTSKKHHQQLFQVKLGSAHNLVYSPALASTLWFTLRLAKEQKINLKTENGINTIFIIVSSNIRSAYVKLGSAHNMVCSPALVLAPRMAIRLAEQ